MAFINTTKSPFYFLIFVALFSLNVNYCFCFNAKNLNASFAGGFSNGFATWYGSPTGPGSVNGACGYGSGVTRPPLNSMVAAGNSNLFKHGGGCGNCYEVVCTENSACSGNPIMIKITDECVGACNDVPYHFDLSGTAFGALAKPGQADTLRSVGKLNVAFKMLPCNN